MREENGSLAGVLSLLIGIPLTVAIIEYSASLHWYAFFWLFWIVCLGVSIILGCIGTFLGTFISSGLDTTTNEQDVCVEKTNENERKSITNVDSRPKSFADKKENPPINVNTLMKELNDLIGLQQVKYEITTLINTVKINKLRKEKELQQSPLSLHLVFSGNPGTGKTTVARILSQIYCGLGILSKGHLVETDRSGMVAGYVGQTAIQTKEIIEKAKGGILFIDEAYSLAPQNAGNDFGREAIDTLLKAMEDYRDDIIVIVAGYPELMNGFIQSNPGLRSRFNTFINFEDYNPEELLKIFLLLCKNNSFSVDPKAMDYLQKKFEDIYIQRNENFANGRTVRNYFEKTIMRQANRLASVKKVTAAKLQLLCIDDLLDENKRMTE